MLKWGPLLFLLTMGMFHSGNLHVETFLSHQADFTGVSEDISPVPRCTLVLSLHLLPDSELSRAENTGICSPKRGLERGSELARAPVY